MSEPLELPLDTLSDEADLPLVEIAVALPVDGTYTYTLPRGLSLSVGHAVVVPVRGRQVTGYVVGFPTERPPVALKPVSRLLDPEPVFGPDQLGFFRWIADYYMAGLGEVIGTALPSAYRGTSRRVFHPTPAGIDALAAEASDPTSPLRAGRIGGSSLGPEHLTVLREVVARLLVQGRKEDTLARVGGDEFVYLLEGFRQVEKVADLARRILQVLESPFRVVGHECFITASVGISLFPKDGKEAESLLKSAETAMYRAKDKGRDNFQIYAHDMHVRALERLKLEQYLRYALARQELELYYQPQVDLMEHRIVGVEALLRWQHPERGLVSPMEFVPLAEETGLIETIGEWALRAACQQAKVWQCQGLPALRVAVNMSPRQFLRSDMADIVARILFETGLEPQHLELEITESLLMKDVESGIATMHALKAIGVRLSIDDFGTGYSSLNYLKQFPIDQLKIDKSFLRGIETNRDDLAITLAVISMAHGMGLTVIAEGVENEMQLAFLRANRCDEIQGYHISRPVPAHEISALLQKDFS